LDGLALNEIFLYLTAKAAKKRKVFKSPYFSFSFFLAPLSVLSGEIVFAFFSSRS